MAQYIGVITNMVPLNNIANSYRKEIYLWHDIAL